MPLTATPTTQATNAQRTEARLRELDRKAARLDATVSEMDPANAPVVSLYQNVIQTIETSGWRQIILDAFDPGMDPFNGLDSGGWRVPLDGFYWVSAVGITVGSTVGKRAAAIALNGRRIRGGVTIASAADGDGDVAVPTPTKLVAATAGDLLTVHFFQNSGTALSTYSSEEQVSALDAHWVRPLISDGMS